MFQKDVKSPTGDFGIVVTPVIQSLKPYPIKPDEKQTCALPDCEGTSLDCFYVMPVKCDEHVS